jgi:hypothetical protein
VLALSFFSGMPATFPSLVMKACVSGLSSQSAAAPPGQPGLSSAATSRCVASMSCGGVASLCCGAAFGCCACLAAD